MNEQQRSEYEQVEDDEGRFLLFERIKIRGQEHRFGLGFTKHVELA